MLPSRGRRSQTRHAFTCPSDSNRYCVVSSFRITWGRGRREQSVWGLQGKRKNECEAACGVRKRGGGAGGENWKGSLSKRSGVNFSRRGVIGSGAREGNK